MSSTCWPRANAFNPARGRALCGSTTMRQSRSSVTNLAASTQSGRGKEGRGKLYQVAERIYCIYYLMRLAGSEAERMRAFVRFMVPLYGEDSLARSFAEAACRTDVRDRDRFIEGFQELLAEEVPEGIRQRVLEATPSAFLDLPEVQQFLSMCRFADTEETEFPFKGVGLLIEGLILDFLGKFEEAIEVFEKMEDKPSIIIMDHRMPNKDGVDTTMHIKNMDSNVKIIFASADSSVRTRAMEAGALEFLCKPFQIKELVESLKKFV